jgi:hypothetical protein
MVPSSESRLSKNNFLPSSALSEVVGLSSGAGTGINSAKK